MISNPITGAKYLFEGFSLINTKGIRRYVLIPLLINILIFSAGLWFAVSQFDLFITWVLSELPAWLSWLEWIMWPLFALTFFGVVFYGFSIVANIIAAPFNGPLATAVERNISAPDHTPGNKPFIKEAKDSILNELVKLKYALFLMMPLIFLSLLSFAFPLVSPLIAILWMVYTVWVLTLEYADYPMANHGIKFPAIREKLASKRLLSLGFGSMVLLGTMIPILNFLVMPIAVAGATKMYIQEFKN